MLSCVKLKIGPPSQFQMCTDARQQPEIFATCIIIDSKRIFGSMHYRTPRLVAKPFLNQLTHACRSFFALKLNTVYSLIFTLCLSAHYFIKIILSAK